ncbi:MAG: hypothetical protein IJV55_01345, partial [Paludibacteraceae bacterium]|nr:hypothetical protein [Paludibacteraceae bacterium]
DFRSLRQIWKSMSRTTQNTISRQVCCVGAFAQRTGLYYQRAVYLYDILKQELETKISRDLIT